MNFVEIPDPSESVRFEFGFYFLLISLTAEDHQTLTYIALFLATSSYIEIKLRLGGRRIATT